ncbi:Cell division topological specificity factor [Thermodesulfobium narugense DSM 14796]|uniref:Cell division topological specificity factor n=1 Tax=Thermodesulfobium narugense DSM 14796 TaxID=747365 RepID=M1E5L1_9BACT|nr:cell division topological specificity factor MinE [Thermodesulfobium narugense]AEE14321.1 Cell division topological specificity factor [Thermodesulfobium narugense DSM 14796]
MGILDFLFKKGDKNSSIAKERLQFVLTFDRLSINPALQEKIRDEIIQVIDKYMEIDKEAANVFVESNDSNISHLIVNIPLKRKR